MKTKMKHQIGGFCEIPDCKDSHYGRGFCKKHHQWHWKLGLIKPAVATIKQKIEEYSVPVPEAGCWIWTRAVNNKGYGTVSVGNQKAKYAHRMYYSEFKGEIPDGMEVCHKCDTPACVNPDHLFLGTHHENMMDSSKKGRIRTTPRSGTRHHKAVFDNESLKYIRTSKESNKQLAEKFGCCKATVVRAKKGQTYIQVANG